jgi:hypothetical protein
MARVIQPSRVMSKLKFELPLPVGKILVHCIDCGVAMLAASE